MRRTCHGGKPPSDPHPQWRTKKTQFRGSIFLLGGCFFTWRAYLASKFQKSHPRASWGVFLRERARPRGKRASSLGRAHVRAKRAGICGLAGHTRARSGGASLVMSLRPQSVPDPKRSLSDSGSPPPPLPGPATANTTTTGCCQQHSKQPQIVSHFSIISIYCHNNYRIH